MLLHQWVAVTLVVCATAVTAKETTAAASSTSDDQRRYDLLSIIRALQYLNSKIQEETMRRLPAQIAVVSGDRSPLVSVDDTIYQGTNEQAFVRGQRALRNPLRFGKRETFRQPLRFGKRANDQMLSSDTQSEQDKRLSGVRNPLRFGKRADVRQPLRFGKRLYSELVD